MKVSLELIYHFSCDYCSKWWSVADYSWPKLSEGRRYITCPHCAQVNALPLQPMTGADFEAQQQSQEKPDD